MRDERCKLTDVHSVGMLAASYRVDHVPDCECPSQQLLAAELSAKRERPLRPDQFVPGFEFDGFCQGIFGRDGYGPRTVSGVGHDWMVCREAGRYVLAQTEDRSSITDLLADIALEAPF